MRKETLNKIIKEEVRRKIKESQGVDPDFALNQKVFQRVYTTLEAVRGRLSDNILKKHAVTLTKEIERNPQMGKVMLDATVETLRSIQEEQKMFDQHPGMEDFFNKSSAERDEA